ncbi:hypothetical protein EVAR_38103_1 [Eumeta japonica]|uniref:Mariner Mos1 transposase n=1 Tax=Eumeta variegata TaxID=151549 RepID=A0A4C1WB11_EUMVA|nr:hypothetical protein EVAR_38103_1 [Eumeta japonica]
MKQRFAGGNSNAVYDVDTGDESCFYCYDLETRRKFAQWVFPFEEMPTKVKRRRSLCNNCFRSKKTVITDWYTNNCLRLVSENVQGNRPGSRILLHYDNASSHTARQTTNNLGTFGLEILNVLPYSAPCDFYLFAKLKRFTDAEQELSASEENVEATPKCLLAKRFF